MFKEFYAKCFEHPEKCKNKLKMSETEEKLFKFESSEVF